MASQGLSAVASGYLQKDILCQLVATAIAFIVVDTFATVQRIFARYLQKTEWMVSDILMPTSLLFQLELCAISFSK
jgi:hypothetical protein